MGFASSRGVRLGLSGIAGLLSLALFLTPVKAAQNPLGLEFHHVTAMVADVDRAVKWYRDTLGFELISRGVSPDGQLQFAELKLPTLGLGLVSQAGSTTTAPAAARTPSWLHIVFSVTDPEQTFRLLASRHVDVFLRKGAANRPITSFLMHDSEGNEIEVLKRADTP